jgi:hypothetical protein
MGLQPIDEGRNDAGDILAPWAGNNSDGLDHFIFCRCAFKADSTLASVSRFHFHEFCRELLKFCTAGVPPANF